MIFSRVIAGRLAVGVLFAGMLAATGCDAIFDLHATTLSLDAGDGGPRSDAMNALRDGGDGGNRLEGGAHDGSRESGARDAARDASPDASGADASDASSPAFIISPTLPSLHPSGMATVTVTLERNGLSGPVPMVTFKNLPVGVTSTTGTIPAAGNTTTLTLSATSSAALGSTIVSLAGGTVPTLKTAILVAGASGTLDTTFGGTGIIVDGIGGTTGVYNTVIVLPNGQIVAAGATGTDMGWAIRRFNSDGTPDSTFNMSAAAALTSESLTTGEIRALAFDPNVSETAGPIVVAGHTGTSAHALAVIRLNLDGTLDSQFSVFTTEPEWFPGSSSISQSVAVLPNSDVVVGVEMNGSVAQVYEMNGTNHTYKGALTPPTPATARSFIGLSLNASVIASAGGFTLSGSPGGAFAAETTLDGSANAAFLSDGGFVTANNDCNPLAMTLQANGTIVVAGPNGSADGWCIGGVKADGTSAFVTSVELGRSYTFTAIASLANESFYVVGQEGDPAAGYEAHLLRFLASGTRDSTFNGDSPLMLGDPNPAPQAYKYITNGLAVQGDPDDGRIIVVGNQTPLASSAGGYLILRVWP